jgi:methyltransferase
MVGAGQAGYGFAMSGVKAGETRIPSYSASRKCRILESRRAPAHCRSPRNPGKDAMLEQSLGAPQIAALLILLQRGFEEFYSARNTARLIAAGGREAGRDYYPVVAITHLAWIAAIFLLIPATAPVLWPLAGLYLLLQVARYWIIATLGRYWTHRIITVPNAPVVRKGPYRFLRHPNYVVTIAETFLLPLVFADAALAVIFGCVWSAVIYYKILLEDAALAKRRGD